MNKRKRKKQQQKQKKAVTADKTKLTILGLLLYCSLAMTNCTTPKIQTKNYPLKSDTYVSDRLKGNWSVANDTVYFKKDANSLNIPMFHLGAKSGSSYDFSGFTPNGHYLNMKVVVKEEIQRDKELLYLVEHVCGNFYESIDYEEGAEVENAKSLALFDRRLYLISYKPFYIVDFFIPNEVNNCLY